MKISILPCPYDNLPTMNSISYTGRDWGRVRNKFTFGIHSVGGHTHTKKALVRGIERNRVLFHSTQKQIM